ncbi:MAG: aminotransferase class III-fold pyridoxal phosphate-dependent enzyme [Phycisphaerales bacterium]
MSNNLVNPIDAKHVHDTLRKHQLVDGYDMVLDLERSHGSWVHDGASDTEFLDAFTCFASWPLGYNHPMLMDEQTNAELLQAARNNPSNSDVYTAEMARFVEAFGTHVTPDNFPYHFWIAGGGLAVENAMKAAFDWKARKLGRTNFHDDVNDLCILHFDQAFHGRTGYTMSVTNTLPDKVGLFPKFHWPKVHNPGIKFDNDGNIANDIEAEEARACAEIETFLSRCPRGRTANGKPTVAGILIETMQGEGGDNHFRPEFLRKLRQYADEAECLLLFDEVQAGFFGSGKPWLWQHHGVEPDVCAFGKKSQVCGVFAGKRMDEVDEHVFVRSSRINSTWGGNLVDMVRSRRFIEIVKQEKLEENITRIGAHVVDGLRSIARETNAFHNVRGVGSLIAFSFESPAHRDGMIKSLYQQKVLALPCGVDSVRFRLPLIMNADEANTLLERVATCVPAAVAAG